MPYSMKCPLCSQSLTIDAETDEDALEKIMKEAKTHVAENHPNFVSLPEEQIKAMVRAGMKKHEAE